MTHRAPLPRALRANAILSLVTGLAGVLMSAPLARSIGGIEGTTYQLLGGMLLLHMLALLWASGRAAIRLWTRVNVAALVLVVCALLALLVIGPVATALGRGLIAACLVVVAALALWQVRALSAATPRPAL